VTSLLSLQPLKNKTVLVTRAAGQSSQFSTMLQQQGAMVLEMPAIEITPPSSWQALDQAIAEIEQFDWLILTSTNGVDYFFERLSALNRLLEQLDGVKIAVVGQKTAERLRQRGRQPDFIPPDFVADSLVEHFPERERLSSLKLLFPRVETGGREILVKELTAQGANVVEVPAYQSSCVKVMPLEIATALQQGQVDIITFASSKTVSCFHQLLQTLAISSKTLETRTEAPTFGEITLLASTCLASIGPQTSATCQQLFGRVDLEAKDYTLDGLTQALIEWVTDQGT
jgi:uroporphyrinogen III methyltransferase/synthase